MTRQFELRREVDLSATVEEVWHAVATGAGHEAWLFPTDDETPEAVGDLFFEHRVQVLDPPHHLRLQAEREDGLADVVEFQVEGRSGGATLRYLHSGVIVSDWEVAYDSAEKHTDFYLHTLGQYLEHFSGRRTVYYGAEASAAGAQPGSFERLRAALGIPDEAVEGDEVVVGIQGAAPVNGVIDYLRPEFLGLRSGDGLYRFFGRDAFGEPVALGHHMFGGHVDEVLEEPAWRGWLERLFGTD